MDRDVAKPHHRPERTRQSFYWPRAGGAANCDPNADTNPPAPTPPDNDELGEPGQDYPNAFWGKDLSAMATTQRKTGRVWPQGDQDHFNITATCPNDHDYLRARVALRTEAKVNLARHFVEYCWSDNGIHCSAGGLIANRLSRTPQGGGTDEFANVPLDVSCISGETSRLSIWVWVPAGTVG
ncbi:MAG: hypothetical protein MJD61_10665, partial [Proteobacteria bacterium]|nr:hypothetical protein [Pseudomonadota bacterium]